MWESTTHFRPDIAVPRGILEALIQQTEHPADRYGQLLLPCFITPEMKRLYRSDRAKLRWYDTIPVEIRDLVWPFPKRQWHMLSFLAHCGSAAADLTLSNPALSFMLASNWVFRKPAVKRPLRSARALLAPGKKQRDVLFWLGFPKTEAARKILAKVPHKALDISRLLFLRQSMDEIKMVKAMYHLPRLNAGVLRIVTDPKLFPFSTNTLLAEIARSRAEEAWPSTSMILEDCADMHSRLFPTRKIGSFRTLTQLMEFHDSLTEDLNRASLVEKKVQFPPPPVNGTDTIIPITDSVQLAEEGSRQHNCVASYIDKVMTNKVFIYRIIWPERATLSLRKAYNKWALSEIKLANNQSPGQKTVDFVLKWLAGTPIDDDLKQISQFEYEEIPI